MRKNKNLLFFIISALIFIIVKFVYQTLSNDDLFLILYPTAKFVALFVGSPIEYFANSGFYFREFNIIINKSCSGVNFALLCYIMTAFIV
ncbi:MAG: exosortase K [Bacteroidales bacterium]|nr:exosortase K [Bacteroidales bacterium]